MKENKIQEITSSTSVREKILNKKSIVDVLGLDKTS